SADPPDEQLQRARRHTSRGRNGSGSNRGRGGPRACACVRVCAGAAAASPREPPLRGARVSSRDAPPAGRPPVRARTRVGACAAASAPARRRHSVCPLGALRWNLAGAAQRLWKAFAWRSSGGGGVSQARRRGADPCACVRRTRLGERMVSMSSTLVETVSINYEDFNESFLTCGTCLCLYDGGEHTPKLLPCSHTVCLHCLARIAASNTRDAAAFRCPICRELISVPRGGVAALPPSFLVNQLLDLMSRQRREVVPKCSVHINQELLFCETCDAVFCALCTGGAHSAAGAAEHTVIPFSIAIKRMSEILLYKANECIAKLSGAREAVSQELARLDRAADGCLEQVGRTFAEAAARLEARRLELAAAVGAARDEKRRVLEEQLALIDAEKSKVERECEGLQYQVEVRNITQRIAGLGDKLEAAAQLSEPRENAFLAVDFAHDDSPARLQAALAAMGRVRSSTSFPALCSVRVEGGPAVTRLEARLTLSTVDYHGLPRSSGGDPVAAEALPVAAGVDAPPCTVDDRDDGTYTVRFRPPAPGRYAVKHNNPVATYGGRGPGKDDFLQPVAVAVDAAGTVYVVDTGNSRIKVGKKGSQKGCFNLISSVTVGPGGEIVVADSRIQVFSAKGDFMEEIYPEGKGRGRYGGVAIDGDGHIIATRSEKSRSFVQVLDFSNGSVVSNIDSHDSRLKRPSGVAATADFHIIVVDLGNDCIKKYRYW
ncbi:Tripartite motif-containing protein 2-like Protein, partial [Gryllus bimaculatus]